MSPAMRLFGQRYGLSALLGTLAAAALLAIGFETRWGQSLRSSLDASASSRKAELVATLPTFTLPSLESGFKETAERPLFLPTRRPVLSNAANAVAMKKGQFKLTGTSVAADMSVAYLLETASGKTIRLAKGREINGITLDIVDAARVVLKQGEETEELTLRTAASPPKAPPAPAGQPGAPAGTSPPGQQPAAFMPGGMAGMPGNTPAMPGLPAAPPAAAPGAAPAAPTQQLPISVLGSAAASQPAAVAAPADQATAAQRRRRFQNVPQQ